MVTMTETIKAEIKGTVSGQVAVGNYILQIGDVNGGVVNVAPPTALPMIEPRPRPVNLKPRPFPSMLDRAEETASIKSAFETSAPVSIFGMGGMGKTSLLRRIAHLPETQNFSDGVVYLSAKEQGPDDLLQLLFDAFHTSSPNTKPTDGQIRNGLHDIKALILLDDLSVERDSIEALLNDMPASMFVFASMARSLWGEGQIVALRGLPENESLMLFEKELGRSLLESEQVSIKDVLSTLEDQPLRILHIASSARESGKSLSEIRDQFQDQDTDAAVAQFSLDTLSESQKKVLAVLGAAGAVVPFQHIANLSEVDRSKEILDSLMILGLVQAHSPRYSLTAVMARTLPTLWDLSTWEDMLIDYFSRWTGQQPARALIEDTMDVLLAVIQKASDKKRWQDVIQLGRTVEQSLIFLKRWQAWTGILNLILAAARASEEHMVEAWTLHQLGSHALCMGMNDQAYKMLTQALNIRQAIGDKAGVAVTQHNLDTLLNPPISQVTKNGRPPRWLGKGLMGLIILAVTTGLVTTTVSAISGNKLPPPISQVIAPFLRSKSTLLASSPSPLPTEPFTSIDLSRPTTHTLLIPDTGATNMLTGHLTITVTQTKATTYSPTTRTPTSTPTFTPTDMPIAQAQVSFAADSTTLNLGECTVLRWNVQFATAVFLDGAGVDSVYKEQVCPLTTTIYKLHVDAPSGNMDGKILINVTPPTSTFTPPPQDTTGPAIFNYKSSPDPTWYGGCGNSVTTFQATVTDPSKISDVEIWYGYSVGKSPAAWSLAPISDLNDGNYSASIDNDAGSQAKDVLVGQDGSIIWYVFATDEFGNKSIIEYQFVSIQGCPP